MSQNPENQENKFKKLKSKLEPRHVAKNSKTFETFLVSCEKVLAEKLIYCYFYSLKIPKLFQNESIYTGLLSSFLTNLHFLKNHFS